MKILSLFDGMACGMLAMKSAGIEVDRYVAYEVDKYAIKTAQHNFPMIEECGDVFKADFTRYRGFDWLVGGSPCTYWSIAQTKNRETEASGLGWELFSQYVRALREASPKFFIYENNKSMAKAIRDSIRETFGFEEVCINSALVSAQNRQRYYWVGKYNPQTGWYDKVDVQQPLDRGILLKNVLDNAVPFRQTASKKGFCLDASYTKTPGSPATFIEGGHARANRSMAAEPVCTTRNGKSFAVTATEYKGGNVTDTLKKHRRTQIAEPVGTTADGKAFALTAYYSTGQNAPHTITKHIGSMVAEPVAEQKVGVYPNEKGELTTCQSKRVYSVEAKSRCLQAGLGGLGVQTGLYGIPVNTTADGKAGTLRATCYKDGIRNMVANDVDRKTCVAEPVPMAVDLQVEGRKKNENGEYVRVWEAKMNQKSSALTSVESRRMVATPVSQCALPCEWSEDGIPTKAVSGSDGKAYPVYTVQDGQITIKGEQYPIKLIDGYYIIRKLTVSECKRLQTVPEWYEFPVSNTQAYKMLGNGWTVEVIAHLIRACMKEERTMFMDKEWCRKTLLLCAKCIKLYCKERPACSGCLFCKSKKGTMRCMFINDDFKPPFPNEWEIPGEEV